MALLQLDIVKNRGNMLQINTGKLFTNGVGRTNELRGVLYTNLKLPWKRDVMTAAGTLRETDGGKDNRAIVYEIEERIEKIINGPEVLISHTVSPFLQDFSAVASFGLNVIMSPDASLATRLTGGTPGLSSYSSPHEFIRRCFDHQVFLQEKEADEFVSFVEQLLGLERRVFLGVMRAIRTYVSGLHRIYDDLGLAYTLMVSAIESLAQDFDGYESTWQDVDERKRNPVDKALLGCKPNQADKIRNAILAVEHPSLGRRYRHFVLSNVDDSYFRTGDALMGRPLARYELEDALKQAYTLRSKYIHNLIALPDELAHPSGYCETVYVERQAALTFQGISRLTRSVIKSFVAGCVTVEHEIYNYRREEAGVRTVRFAPEVWMGRGLTETKHIGGHLEGFLEQLSAIYMRTPDAKLTDQRPTLADIERLIPKATKTHKPAMVALHVLFNCFVREEDRTNGYAEFRQKYGEELTPLSNEALLARTICRSTSVWSIEDHQRAHDTYFRQRARPNGVHAPRTFDAAISLELAERYRKAEQLEGARRLIAIAVENYPSHNPLLEMEKKFTGDDSIDWETIIFSPPAS